MLSFIVIVALLTWSIYLCVANTWYVTPHLLTNFVIIFILYAILIELKFKK